MFRILFVCAQNDARSLMAEAFLNQLGAPEFYAESTGFEKGKPNGYVSAVMREIGLEINNDRNLEIFDLFQQGRHYQAVISLLDKSTNETCPIYPGMCNRLTWSFPNPASFTGNEADVLAKTREVRDEIRETIIDFVSKAHKLSYWTLENSDSLVSR